MKYCCQIEEFCTFGWLNKISMEGFYKKYLLCVILSFHIVILISGYLFTFIG